MSDHEEDVRRNKELIEILKRRKHEREIQLAQFGVGADPVIKMEIQDIANVIQRLEKEIGNLSDANKAKEYSVNGNKISFNDKRAEAFSELLEYIEQINGKVDVLVQEVHKIIATKSENYAGMRLAKHRIVFEYELFLSFYGGIRLRYVPNSVNDLINQYKFTLMGNGMMEGDVVKYVNVAPGKLRDLLDKIVTDMQKYVE